MGRDVLQGLFKQKHSLEINTPVTVNSTEYFPKVRQIQYFYPDIQICSKSCLLPDNPRHQQWNWS